MKFFGIPIIADFSGPDPEDTRKVERYCELQESGVGEDDRYYSPLGDEMDELYHELTEKGLVEPYSDNHEEQPRGFLSWLFG